MLGHELPKKKESPVTEAQQLNMDPGTKKLPV